MQRWARSIEAELSNGTCALLCIEQPCPGLLNFFQQFAFFQLYLINPITLSRYREAFNPSKAKDDKKDAFHLARLVFEKDLLPRWSPDASDSRKLDILSEKAANSSNSESVSPIDSPEVVPLTEPGADGF